MGLGKRLCVACAGDGRHAVAKYRCPACDVASCSLPCVKKHKAETNCSGIRNRAAPVRKAEYTDTHLMSDFTFLEDTARAIDSATRTRQSTVPYVNGRSSGYATQAPGVSKGRMNMLIREANKRNIHLRFMPRGYARHARNSSYVRSIPEHDPPLPPEQRKETRDKAMYWHLDIYFASCGTKCPGTKMVKVDGCEEEQLIGAVVEGAMGALQKGKKRRRSDKFTCSSKANDGYAKYLQAKLDELEVFLRNEHVLSVTGSGSESPRVSAKPKMDELDINRYVAIDTNQSLRQVLNGRAVVEFPILHIAFKGSKEAKELTSAISGIFEKPEESSGSGSSSESEAGDDEDDLNLAKPDSPVRDPLKSDNTKPDTTTATARPSDGSSDKIGEAGQEPMLKHRKIESASNETNHAVSVENREKEEQNRTKEEHSKEEQNRTKEEHSEVKEGQNKAKEGDSKTTEEENKTKEEQSEVQEANIDVKEEAKNTEDVIGDSKKSIPHETTETAFDRAKDSAKESAKDEAAANISVSIETDRMAEEGGRRELQSSNESEEKNLSKDGLELDATNQVAHIEDGFPMDAASRGSGFHLQQPFTKDSFKAILETRIPRKPRQDRSNSAKQSSAATLGRLTASG